MSQRIVVRYQDGRILKGSTGNFLPTGDAFHVMPANGPSGTRPVEVRTGELKAMFFVKDFAGNPSATSARSSIPPTPRRAARSR